MLAPAIKELIECKFEKKIRYSSDFEHLSYEIEKETKQRISTNTLKRLFGFIEGVREPRLYTLDIIAHYLGHDQWDDLLADVAMPNSAFVPKTKTIYVETLEKGTKILFTYYPNRRVLLEYIGEGDFVVVNSINSKLLANDIVSVAYLTLKHPFYALDVERDGKSLGSFIAGKVSGLTSLSIVK